MRSKEEVRATPIRSERRKRYERQYYLLNRVAILKYQSDHDAKKLKPVKRTSPPQTKAELYENNRNKRLWVSFRLTADEWENILKYQKGVCAITGRPAGKYRLSTDHDHKTGRIRGLLTPWVNRALSLFQDNPQWLRAAADYLDDPSAPKALGKETYGLIGKAFQKKRNMKYGPPQGIERNK